MKRLFEVNGEFFADKAAAKTARGEPTAKAEGKTPAQYKFEIRLGPDHWKRGGSLPGTEPRVVKVPRVRKKAAA